MENELFRKNAMERISEPEQLNEYIKVTNPAIWSILAGLCIIIVALGIWMFSGTILDTVEVEGIAFSAGTTESIYTYLPLTTAKRLLIGMKAQVSPDYASREEFGYIHGTVSHIGVKPMNDEEIINRFGSVSYVSGLLPEGNFVEVTISLEKNNGLLRWSNSKGEQIKLEELAYCTTLIVIKERKPYQLLFSH